MMRNGNSMPPLKAVVHGIGTARSVPSRKREKKKMRIDECLLCALLLDTKGIVESCKKDNYFVYEFYLRFL